MSHESGAEAEVTLEQAIKEKYCLEEEEEKEELRAIKPPHRVGFRPGS